MKQIVIIGPTAPLFKGGIVHFTHGLSQELAHKHKVTVIGFSRAYPRFIYKGKVGETDDDAYSDTPLLDWANPLSWHTVASYINKLNPDVVVLQWWTLFWAPVSTYLLRTIKSKKIVIVHNVSDHDSKGVSFFLSRMVLSQADCFMTHASAMKHDLKTLFPEKPVGIHLHPTHTMFSSLPPRKLFNNILFFGHVRPYKGLDLLIQGFSNALVTLPTLHLTIAGEFWGKQRKETKVLTQKLNIEKNISIHDEYIPNEAVISLFGMSDAVVLPYRSATGTAVSKIALATGTPIIGTPVGDIPDIFKLGDVGVLARGISSNDITSAIVSFYKKNINAMRNEVCAVSKKITWNSYASTMLRL